MILSKPRSSKNGACQGGVDFRLLGLDGSLPATRDVMTGVLTFSLSITVALVVEY